MYSPNHFLSTDIALIPHQEQDLHVYILPEHLSPNNIALRNEEIWGSNPYSQDSDAVCILQHSGLYDVLATSSSHPSADMLALKLVLRIHPGTTELQGSERHALHSKPGSSNVTLSALQFHILKSTEPALEQLRNAPLYGPPRPNRATSAGDSALASSASNKMDIAEDGPSAVAGTNTHNSQLSSDTSTSAPGMNGTNGSASSAPSTAASSSQAHGNASSSAGGARRHHKRPRRQQEEIDHRVSIDVLPDTILQFNLSNELSFQYNLNLICDRGIEPAQWTSHRLRHAVLMIETLFHRFELSWEQDIHPHTATNAQFDTYRFALVEDPCPKTRAWHATKKVPLDAEYAKPVHRALDWSQLVWGPATLTILGNTYHLRRIYWLSRSTESVATASNGASSSSAPHS